MLFVYVLLIAVMSVGIGPCPGLAEMQLRAAEGRSDDAIADRAKAALSRNVYVKSSRIGVSVNDGILSLAGIVDSYFERLRAEYAVFAIDGVRHVINGLETVSERAWKRDEELREAIEQVLLKGGVNDDTIHVGAKDGIVTLTGTVSSGKERRDAVEKAYERGARAVRNHVMVFENYGLPHQNR